MFGTVPSLIAAIRSEKVKWSKLIKEIGINPR
jgi:hypothetical protein